jgi:hypothetical protein
MQVIDAVSMGFLLPGAWNSFYYHTYLHENGLHLMLSSLGEISDSLVQKSLRICKS